MITILGLVLLIMLALCATMLSALAVLMWLEEKN